MRVLSWPADFAIVAADVAGVHLGKHLVAAVHLGGEPAQHAHGAVGFHFHLADKVGQAVEAD